MFITPKSNLGLNQADLLNSYGYYSCCTNFHNYDDVIFMFTKQLMVIQCHFALAGNEIFNDNIGDKLMWRTWQLLRVIQALVLPL